MKLPGRRPGPKSKKFKQVGKKTGKKGRYGSTSTSKVCLLCLRRFDESILSKLLMLEEEDDNKKEILEVEVGESDDECTILSSTLPQVHEMKEEERKRKRSLYIRFLTIMSRYLNIRTKRLRNSALRNSLPPPFCEECFGTVEKMCEAYEELDKVRLVLFWRLSQISTSIRVANTKVSGKLGSSLIKNLSNQMRVRRAEGVDILRKQIAIKCSAKMNSCPPKVAIKRMSHVFFKSAAAAAATATNHHLKLQYPLEVMRQYLKCLIVVFALAVPPREAPPQGKLINGKIKTTDSPVKSRDKNCSNDIPENKKIKMELHGGNETGDDGHYDEAYSPGGGSGPASPIGNNGDEGQEQDENDAGSDASDWSANVGSEDSDVDFRVDPGTAGTRRWNLRKRRTRSSGNVDNDKNDNDDEVEEYPLPPLRAPKGSKVRPVVPESEKKFACNLCSQRFRLERGLRRHLTESHAFAMSYNCSKCNKKFRRKMDLDLHNRKMHKSARIRDPIAVPCTVCKKVFASKLKMMFHRKTVHKLKAIVCEVCGRTIIGQFRYERHLRKHNKINSRKPYTCSKCPWSFASEELREKHEKQHDDPNFSVLGRKRGPVPMPRPEGSEGDYQCQFPNCGRRFFREVNLTTHMSFHSIACELCKRVFNDVRGITKHLRTVHEKKDEINHFCLHCHKGFTVPQALDLHSRVIHPTKTIECDVENCNECKFDNAASLLEHLKGVHFSPEVEQVVVELNYDIPDNRERIWQRKFRGEKGEAEEPTNGRTTTEPVVLSNHPPPSNDDPSVESDQTKGTQETNIKLYLCGRCKWPFSRKAFLDVHMRTHTPPDDQKVFNCRPCKQKFVTVDNLTFHYNRFHGPNIYPFQCGLCGTRFIRRNSYLKHAQKCKGGKKKGRKGIYDSKPKRECHLCEEEFDTCSEYTQHMNAFHPDAMFQCSESNCSEKFKRREQLVDHLIKQHSFESKFKCETCSKYFPSKARLLCHQLTHRDKTLPCPVPDCTKLFRRKINLDLHIKVHYQIKDHICQFCGKAFVNPSSLKIHLDIHLGIKNYSCSYCDKKFCRKFSRDCHERTHTNEKPYVCRYCGRAFNMQTTMKSHEKAHERLNSDEVSRGPKRRIARKPLKSEEGVEEQVGSQDDVSTSASASNIIHEALQAAFEDINMDLVDALPKTEENTTSTSGSTVDTSAAVESSNGEEPPNKVKRGRGKAPKNYKAMLSGKKETEKETKTSGSISDKDLVCGFCGKEFTRKDHYKKHVDKHLNFDSIGVQVQEPIQGSSSDAILQQPAMPSPVSQPTHTPPPVSPAVAQCNPPPPAEPPKKKRGRPRRDTPGSRLERIVEDVREAASKIVQSSDTPIPSGLTITPVSAPSSSVAPTMVSYHNQQQQQPHYHPHQQSFPQHPSPHMNDSSHHGGSPAHLQHQQNVTTAPSTTSSISFPASSYLSPFLLSNPYLIARSDSQQTVPQTLTNMNLIQNQQQQHGQQNNALVYSPGHSPSPNQTHEQQQQSPLSFTHQSHLQYHQQQALQQHAPHDLSKSGFSMFYANPRN